MDDLKPKITIKYGSSRNFGIVFSIVFLIVGIWTTFHNLGLSYFWFILSLVFISISILKPSLLTYPNFLWFKFGMILNSIVSPVIMFLVYVLTFIPTKIFFIITNKDPLDLKFDETKGSYWIKREAEIQSMDKQF